MELKEKIEKKGINKSWLARQLGIPQSTLSAGLNKTRPLSEGIVKKINEIIG